MPNIDSYAYSHPHSALNCLYVAFFVGKNPVLLDVKGFIMTFQMDVYLSILLTFNKGLILLILTSVEDS